MLVPTGTVAKLYLPLASLVALWVPMRTVTPATASPVSASATRPLTTPVLAWTGGIPVVLLPLSPPPPQTVSDSRITLASARTREAIFNLGISLFLHDVGVA